MVRNMFLYNKHLLNLKASHVVNLGLKSVQSITHLRREKVTNLGSSFPGYSHILKPCAHPSNTYIFPYRLNPLDKDGTPLLDQEVLLQLDPGSSYSGSPYPIGLDPVRVYIIRLKIYFLLWEMK